MPQDSEIRRRVESACVENERKLRAFLTSVLRDSHLADDAYQRMVVKAIEAADSVDPDKVEGWLFQIALNEGRELKRKSARQERLQQRVMLNFLPREASDGDGLGNLLSDESRELVRAALKRLDENYREVVTRRIEKGQSFATIAKEMNKPLGTVLTWMRRALQELRGMSELRALFRDD